MALGKRRGLMTKTMWSHRDGDVALLVTSSEGGGVGWGYFSASAQALNAQPLDGDAIQSSIYAFKTSRHPRGGSMATKALCHFRFAQQYPRKCH